MYYKITCTNGYCGCDENFYIEAENNSDAWDEANEILENDYSFIYPDERFVYDMDDEEELENYAEGVDVFVEEISKKEYLEAKEWGY
jgi:hypothetical protein